MKQGKAHPHKWGKYTEEQMSNLQERMRKLTYDKATEFGKAFFEHYHIKQRDNRKLYQRERTYYKKFGRFSWDDGIDLSKSQVRFIQKN